MPFVRRSFWLSYLVILASACAQEEEHRENETKIINGAVVSDVSDPAAQYTVALMRGGQGVRGGKGRGWSHFCSGTLAENRRFVVSAAHCFMDIRPGTPLAIGMGTHFHGTEVQLFPVQAFKVSKPSRTRRAADISYLVLKNPVSKDFMPLEILSEAEAIKSGEDIYLSGYGLSNDDGQWEMDGRLRSTVSRASRLNSRTGFIETDSSDQHKVCNGDSGGPLAVRRGKKLYLAGAVSHGSIGNCDVRETQFFTYVPAHRTEMEEFFADQTGHELLGAPRPKVEEPQAEGDDLLDSICPRKAFKLMATEVTRKGAQVEFTLDVDRRALQSEKSARACRIILKEWQVEIDTGASTQVVDELASGHGRILPYRVGFTMPKSGSAEIETRAVRQDGQVFTNRLRFKTKSER